MRRPTVPPVASFLGRIIAFRGGHVTVVIDEPRAIVRVDVNGVTLFRATTIAALDVEITREGPITVTEGRMP